MTSVTYHGHVTMTYGDFIDLATGRTLVCTPGQAYDIMPASGNIRSAALSMPADGQFTEEIPEEKPAEDSPSAEIQGSGELSATSDMPSGKE